jgi:hypothetical protein
LGLAAVAVRGGADVLHIDVALVVQIAEQAREGIEGLADVFRLFFFGLVSSVILMSK